MAAYKPTHTFLPRGPPKSLGFHMAGREYGSFGFIEYDWVDQSW
jgi:hypothetical protein